MSKTKFKPTFDQWYTFFRADDLSPEKAEREADFATQRGDFLDVQRYIRWTGEKP